MTMLSNVEIREAIESGEIRIEPFRPANVQPASYDLTLGRGFTMFYEESGCGLVDPFHEDTYPRHFDSRGDGFCVPAKRGFTLGHTVEVVTLGDGVSSQVGGKSSLARLGLEVHLTAGHIDPGFSGSITLEIVNNGPSPIWLTAGMPIGQITFTRLGTPANPPYAGKYIGAASVQTSRYYRNQFPTVVG